MSDTIYPYLVKGIVEDNNDPLRSSRLKIRVGDMHGSKDNGIPTNMLPWANPVGPMLTNVFPVGSIVYVMFERGDKYYPVYFGYMIKKPTDSQCWNCQNYTDLKRCLAYPNGIPDEIYNNILSHDFHFDGDNGIIYVEKV